MTTKDATLEVPTSRLPVWLMAIIPLAVLVATVVIFLSIDPLSVFTGEVPPVEVLQAQRVVLNDEGIEIRIINSGIDTVNLAQVIVDDAYWNFTIEDNDSELSRLEQATIQIPYPWVDGEAHEVLLVSSTGVTFPVEIPVAVATPKVSGDQLLAYALLGVYVGIIPVGLGLLWYPFIRQIDYRWKNFFLALTVGMLVFLAVDTLLEGIEVSAEVPGTFQGQAVLWLVAALTLLAIVAVGSNSRMQAALFLAYMIALGIGFHNLGEGLAVGTAFAIGEASLATFLVVGFTLHNITEGIGIAAPIAGDKRPQWYHFLLLALVAGAPAILGTLIGGFAFNPLVAVIFLGIGAGAILQVVYEVSRLIIRDSQKHGTQALSWLNIGGLVVGIAIMYFTAFLVK